jgi:hypothetical protein
VFAGFGLLPPALEERADGGMLPGPENAILARPLLDTEVIAGAPIRNPEVVLDQASLRIGKMQF